MQFQFVEKIKVEKKVKKIIFKITANKIIKILKTLHFYEKQQKKNNIDFIRSLKLYKKDIKARKLYNSKQITLNKYFN